MDKEEYQSVYNELTDILGDNRVHINQEILNKHSGGFSYHLPYPPDFVVYPTSTTEVSQLLTCCSLRKIPIIAFGAGTSVEGHVSAIKGGVCLDMSQMNKILDINEVDGNVTVQAGVTRLQLDEKLKGSDYMFPIGPEINATLGGMAATRASGTNAVRYGTMKDNVVSMCVVMQDGQVIKTGATVKKSASGYDLTRLFIGSEGTLGVITELTLKLYPRPETIFTVVCSFPSIDAAVNATVSMLRKGLCIAKVELLDKFVMNAVNAYSGLNYAIAPTLFMEFHCADTEVKQQIKKLKTYISFYKGFGWKHATTPEEISALWKARADVVLALLSTFQDRKIFGTDVCVPLSKLAGCINETSNDIIASGLTAPILGHIGDGNFHLAILINPNSDEDINTAKALSDKIVLRALKAGGTCTGEHGIGYGKLPYMEMEHKEALTVMRMIKQALDPHNLMNPGKLIVT